MNGPIAERNSPVTRSKMTQFAENLKWCVVMVFSLCSVLLSAAAFAQSSNEVEKMAALKALYVACGASKMAEVALPQIVTAMEKEHHERAVARYKRQDTLLPEEIQKRANEDTAYVFKRFRQLLPQKVNFNHQLELVTLTSWDQHLSLDELRFLLAFYESPTGPKCVKWTQDLQGEADKWADETKPFVAKLAMEANTGKPAGTFTPADHSAELSALPAERQALIRQILEAGGITISCTNTYNLSVAKALQEEEQRFQADPNLTTEGKKKGIEILKEVGPLLVTRIDTAKLFTPYLILSMNSHFTDQELHELLKFYRDPKCKSALALMGEIQQEARQSASALLVPKIEMVYRQAMNEKTEEVMRLTTEGMNLAEAGNLDESMKKYQDALSIDPDCAAAGFGVGSIYHMKGELHKALWCYEKAAKLAPNNKAFRVSIDQLKAQIDQEKAGN